MSQWKRKNRFVSRCVPPMQFARIDGRLRAPAPEKYHGQRRAFLIGAHHPAGRAMRKAVSQ